MHYFIYEKNSSYFEINILENKIFYLNNKYIIVKSKNMNISSIKSMKK